MEAEKQKRGYSRSFTVIVIAAILVVLVGVIAVTALFITGGDGEASQDASDAVTALEATDAEAQVYEIQSAGTEARFYIDETLRGEPVTVIGITSDVGGQMTIDPANPANSEVGEIVINARTLQTDNIFRNRALRSFILLSAQDEYEFIRFQPTEISGLPSDAVADGTSVEFQMTGDLTIVEVTESVTFDVTVTLGADDVLSGTASTVVQYADYNLTIPDAPGVANVQDDVRLELEFIATPMQEAAEEADTSDADEADTSDADESSETSETSED